ncbi:MAG: diguanylate cyclase [Sphingomonas adhaesiva]|uniref:diguanylate cyclase domain-containing protein n=1 Tax=Sphingomonas adhaesiva TaxID=28212 RepID=UPI002FFC8EBF
MHQPAPTDRLDDESARIAALRVLALMDAEPQQEFTALTTLASRLIGCPTALINMVDRDRVWITAGDVPGPRELRRDVAFCDRTIRTDSTVIIDDLAQDTEYATNPLVTEGGMRFYAGAPLHVEGDDGERHAVGTICVIDRTPRTLDPAEREALLHLATLAETLLASRRAAVRAVAIATRTEELLAEVARRDSIFRQAERIAMIGSWRLSVLDHTLTWSDNVFRIYGLPHGEQPPPSDRAIDFYPAAMRPRIGRMLDESIRRRRPFDFESDFHAADGTLRRVRSIGEPEIVDDRVVALVGVFMDMTERYALEQQLRRSADTDALTGLANRAAFDRTLEAAMARARQDGGPLMLALVDLDGFKAINDTLGHDAGDEVLRLTGAALTEPWLNGVFAARIGGDEFALVIEDPVLVADVDSLRDRVEAALRVTVESGGITMASGGSVGIAPFDANCASLREFARRADTVLYAMKRSRIGRQSARRAA